MDNYGYQITMVFNIIVDLLTNDITAVLLKIQPFIMP